jgi:hypothetical protein
MKKFREEDLILYLYKDCSPALQTAIEQALTEDLALQDQLKILKRTLKQLDKLKLVSPSKPSIKAIMQYAKELKKK